MRRLACLALLLSAAAAPAAPPATVLFPGPTPAQEEVVKRHWSDVVITHREYDRTTRTYVDYVRTTGHWSVCVHNEADYEFCLYVLDGRFFAYDHSRTRRLPKEEEK